MQQQKQVSVGEGIAAANAGVRSGGGGGGAGGGGGGSVSVCRPSGSRWTPTPEQLRMLKELYYGCGVRSPTAEQIQHITGMLRQHGKIEGKNVFYWFQNHKARERQKKRLTNLDVNAAPAAGADVNHLGVLSLSPSGLFASLMHGLAFRLLPTNSHRLQITMMMMRTSGLRQARRLPLPPWACTTGMAAPRP